MHAARDSFPLLPKLHRAAPTIPCHLYYMTLNASGRSYVTVPEPRSVLKGCTVFPIDASDGHDRSILLTMWHYSFDCLVLGQYK